MTSKENKKSLVDEEIIERILTRGVEDLIVKEDLRKELLSGRKLRVKFGIDPTGPKIHLGRAIPLRKLREFQKLGHQAVLIVGDFTAQIGDASDKTEKRPMLTKTQISENLKDYKNQIAKIIDVSKAEIVYNSDWLSKLTLEEIIELGECFTVQQMLARRNFHDRYEQGKEITLREFFYPLMQGYDSVAVKADVEIGGFDQLFNLKAGRILQERFGQKKQNILTTQMLEGTNGEKMSTSQGNVINIVDEPNDMFGKIMSMKDDLIVDYLELCTDDTEAELVEAKKFLEDKNNNPRDLKLELAKKIVTLYHGEKLAKLAEDNFLKTFQKKDVPSNMAEIIINQKNQEKELLDILVEEKFIKSKSEAKRLFSAKAIKEIVKDGEQIKEKTITDYKVKVFPGVFKVGKKTFVKILV